MASDDKLHIESLAHILVHARTHAISAPEQSFQLAHTSIARQYRWILNNAIIEHEERATGKREEVRERTNERAQVKRE